MEWYIGIKQRSGSSSEAVRIRRYTMKPKLMIIIITRNECIKDEGIQRNWKRVEAQIRK